MLDRSSSKPAKSLLSAIAFALSFNFSPFVYGHTNPSADEPGCDAFSPPMTGTTNLATMERGAYNANAGRPAAGVARALHLIERAAQTIDRPNGPIVIADIGCSQGVNSLRPMAAAIQILRDRFGNEISICVSHTDLPTNDFATLFQTIQSHPASYVHAANVFTSAVGKTFYEQLFPDGQVSIAWSSYAAMWLSRAPTTIPGHYWEQRATGAEREAFDTQAASDWRTFLSMRARELGPNGRLVIAVAALDENDGNGAEPMHDAANDSLAALVARGVITADERERMVVPGRLRGRRQLLEPFIATGSFAGLSVEEIDIFKVPEGAFAAFRENGNKRALAAARAGFHRAVFAPSLADALSPERDFSYAETFKDALRDELIARLESQTEEMPSTAAIMLLVRGGLKKSTSF